MFGRFLFVLNFILFPFVGSAQSISDIKASNDYYWGQGNASSLELADRKALEDLISQISVQVETSIFDSFVQDNGNYTEYAESITKTYSNATLVQAERKVLEKSDEIIVLRYIKRDKMRAIFAERLEKVKDYVVQAQNAQVQLRIGDALKFYYWALCLLRSHPECGTFKYKLDTEAEGLLLVALPDKINAILNDVKISIDSVVEDQNDKIILFGITYKGYPVQNFDFTYWTGDTWTAQNGIQNGFGAVELSGEISKSITNLRLRAECAYLQASKIDLDLENVLKNTDPPILKNTEFKLPIKNTVNKQPKLVLEQKRLEDIPNEKEDVKDIIFKKEVIDSVQNEVLGYSTTEIESGSSKIIVTEDRKTNAFDKAQIEYVSVVNEICNAIKNKTIDSVAHWFSPDAFGYFKTMMSLGNPKLLPITTPLSIYKLKSKTIIGKVPVLFKFKATTRRFIEGLVFTIGENDKITNVAFSAGANVENNIMKMDREFGSLENKYELIQFIQNYITAYCIGDLGFLEKVFDDNALIIVGKVLKNSNIPLDADYGTIGADEARYLRLSKKEYLQNLKKVYAKNEFVNIQFDSILVKNAKRGCKVYGIQFAQNWYSTSYSDKGYLYLMFDLQDESKPQIYVRTWQSAPDKKGKVFSNDDFPFTCLDKK